MKLELKAISCYRDAKIISETGTAYNEVSVY